MANRTKWILLLLILAAVFLRLKGLFYNTFHADEALFATWARLIAVWRDPLLKSQLVDKPPLLFYLQALFYPLLGPVEWAARLPNLIASILIVPATAILAWRLYRQEAVALFSAAFVAFSPLAVQYSATGFTDPLLSFFLTISCASISGLKLTSSEDSHSLSGVSSFRYALISGLFFGLAITTKFQAVLFLPLVIGLALLLNWDKSQWILWIIGLATCLALLAIWEFARSGSFTLLDTQLNSFGGLRMSWSWELWPRLEAWAGQWQYLVGSPILIFGLLLSLPLFLALLIDRDDKSTEIDQLFFLFLILYFAFHWLVAIPTWDRYLVPIIPFVGLVLSRFIARVLEFVAENFGEWRDIFALRPRVIGVILIILISLQAGKLKAAYEGALPVGGQPGADLGSSVAAEALRYEPYGTVLYDHWYSWLWRYELFDSNVYVSWFSGPDELVEDLKVFANGTSRRFIALPADDEALPVIRAIKENGFHLIEVPYDKPEDRETQIILYQIVSSEEN